MMGEEWEKFGDRGRLIAILEYAALLLHSKGRTIGRSKKLNKSGVLQLYEVVFVRRSAMLLLPGYEQSWLKPNWENGKRKLGVRTGVLSL